MKQKDDHQGGRGPKEQFVVKGSKKKKQFVVERLTGVGGTCPM